jgi:hypothetical protein
MLVSPTRGAAWPEGFVLYRLRSNGEAVMEIQELGMHVSTDL